MLEYLASYGGVIEHDIRFTYSTDGVSRVETEIINKFVRFDAKTKGDAKRMAEREVLETLREKIRPTKLELTSLVDVEDIVTAPPEKDILKYARTLN